MPILVDPKKLSMPEQVQENLDNINKNNEKIINTNKRINDILELQVALTADSFLAINPVIGTIVKLATIHFNRVPIYGDNVNIVSVHASNLYYCIFRVNSIIGDEVELQLEASNLLLSDEALNEAITKRFSVVFPSGTNVLEFDFSPYKNGTQFIGNNLSGIPEEISRDHSQMVLQLIKNNDSLYCLKLYNTGLYNGNQGEYITYHYATSYTGWHRVAIKEEIFNVANKRIEGDLECSKGTLTKTFYTKMIAKNNSLYLIINSEIIPEKFGSQGRIQFVFNRNDIAITDEDWKRIYRNDGTNLTQAPKDIEGSAGRVITAVPSIYYHENLETGIIDKTDIISVQVRSNAAYNVAIECYVSNYTDKGTLMFRTTIEL